MNWIPLISDAQLLELNKKSTQKPQVIFKHSTRCSISSVVLNRLKRFDLPQEIDFYFLEVPAQRIISNKVAELYSVYHESPQILLIRNGECIYDESHAAIEMEEIIEQVSK
ncbi:MAG: bacillithiol system redox-active protein YtxJ [Ferruginibacter sp.]